MLYVNISGCQKHDSGYNERVCTCQFFRLKETDKEPSHPKIAEFPEHGNRYQVDDEIAEYKGENSVEMRMRGYNVNLEFDQREKKRKEFIDKGEPPPHWWQLLEE